MKVVQNMMYLGYESRVSNKTGKSYLLVKTMENNQIFEWYVPADKLNLVTSVGQQQPFTEIKCGFEVSSRNMKAELNLEHVEAVKK
jgi:hypothetical protein